MKHLIVVDVQNEWRTKGSDYYLGDLSILVNQTNKLIDHCRKLGHQIIFIRHIEKNSPVGFAEDNERSALINELHREKEDVIIKKYKISPFFGTNLEEIISRSEKVIVCGILTNLCVRSLVNDLYDRDYPTTLVEDCCISVDKATHEFTLQDIHNTRQEVNIIKLIELIP